MAKRIVRDYRSMTIEELGAAVREAKSREKAARYAKGRRGWKQAWQEAEQELLRRSAEPGAG
jgi:hypothetical protein